MFSITDQHEVSIDGLIESLRRHRSIVDADLIRKAFHCAERAHLNQHRRSGEPYIAHPLAVAYILSDWKVDDPTIAAALLHDTIEDTSTQLSDIENLFGRPIARIVEGLTKIDRLNLSNRIEAQAESLRKLLLAVAVDVRVLLIKLADRLHNMQTLRHLTLVKQQRISQETMDIYAPLAGRMGMQGVQETLQDLGFRILNPNVYSMIAERLIELRHHFADDVVFVSNELTARLSDQLQDIVVTGREKRPFAIWSKMERKSIAFEMLSDIYGFRIIVRDAPDCYAALGVVHTAWQAVPGRFKDHISAPKQNDYRSLHTTIIGSRSERIELQIRSRQMHELAEYGIAAHTFYKEGPDSPDELRAQSRAYAWLRSTIKLLSQENASSEEFLEHAKLELFYDQVFCFTPKGRLIALPRKATPVDFAYAVHTDVGNACIGCKINGQSAPLTYKLRNGDEVEITTSPGQKVAPPSLAHAVVTGKARSAIRRSVRMAERNRNADLGRHILQTVFNREQKTFNDAALEPARRKLRMGHLLDLLAEVGSGKLESEIVFQKIFPNYQSTRQAGDLLPASPVEEEPSSTGWFRIESEAGMLFRIPDPAEGDFTFRAIRRAPVTIARGFGALPGEPIVGVVDSNSGITIYPTESSVIRSFSAERTRWIDVRWDMTTAQNRRFPTRIWVTSINEPGSLAAIATTFADNDANVDNLTMLSRSSDFHELNVDLELWSLSQLNDILLQLRSLSGIHETNRFLGEENRIGSSKSCPFCGLPPADDDQTASG